METVWQALKKSWDILKKDVSELGIDPNKNTDDLTLSELYMLAGDLNISASELLETL